MSTELEIMKYVNLADAGYSGGLTPMGWEILTVDSNAATGFHATAYQNLDSGEIVVSYAGTDDFTDATHSDTSLVLQNVPEQYAEARDFYDKVINQYGSSNLTITGHSLGGSLAQLIGAYSKQTTYAFNAPGVDDMRLLIDELKLNTNDASSFTNINNYNMSYDVASNIGTQLGNVVNYDPSSLEGLAIFASIAATVANPLVGSIIFGKTILGQHYMNRLQEAIATPKSTEYINGYTFNEQTGEWGSYDAGTDSYKIADEQTTQNLNSQLQENYEYNALALQANKLLTEYRGWQTATEQLRAQYGQIWTDFDPSFDGNTGWFKDTNGNYIAQFEIVEENGQNLLRVLGENGQTVNLDTGDVSGKGTLFYDLNSGLQNLVDGFSNFQNDINNSETGQTINTYGPSIIDALSLVKAIQSGEPLPVVTSGLRLANDISIINNNPNYILSGAANATSGVLSIMSLDAALKRGDGWAIATSSAYTISFAATAYAQFATQSALTGSGELAKAMTDVYGQTAGSALNSLNGALPYLGLAAAIALGDETAIAVAAVSIAFPPLGMAYAIYSIVDSLFGGDDIPDPWGTGRYVWDGTSIKVQSAGETGGNEAVSGVMQSVITAMNSLIEQQRLTNPTS
ncbi:MAG: YqiA/YcfP family alpha/beta fold hydrolase, partial [Sulfurimonas sp.]|uniref:YqiA/YcfP family alpha/beta fold hydrolase n=1 Tax=Sulfurimonas sp. TaxID=2022749 RepID=UPI0028CE6D73